MEDYRVMYIKDDKMNIKRMTKEELGELKVKEIYFVTDMSGNVIIDNRKKAGV